MVRGIRRHLESMRNTDFAEYTFERRRSTYPQAKSDLIVYNSTGTPVLHGRETDGPLAFWTY
jgi:hypothetical protein